MRVMYQTCPRASTDACYRMLQTTQIVERASRITRSSGHSPGDIRVRRSQSSHDAAFTRGTRMCDFQPTMAPDSRCNPGTPYIVIQRNVSFGPGRHKLLC